MTVLRELLWPICWHAALGVLLALVVWLSGMGIAALTRRFGSRDLVLAYPLGLLAVVVVAFVALLNGAAGIVGVILVAGLCWYGLRERGTFGEAPFAALRAAAQALPFALGYALIEGVLVHGASSTLDAHPLGDNATWVSETLSASHDPVHLHDLTALGQVFPRPETSTVYVTAALGRVVHVDLYLAGTSLLTVFLVVSVAAGFGALRVGQPRLKAPIAGGIALLALASVGYPSWIPESPPVAMTLPLAFAAYWLLTSEAAVGVILAIAAVLAIDVALTKILAGSVIVVAAAAALARAPRASRLRSWVIAAIVGAACVAVASYLMFTSASWIFDQIHLRFLPWESIKHGHELLHIRRFQTLGPLAQLFGVLALMAMLARARRWTLLVMVLASALPYWLLGGQNFEIALYLTYLVVAVDICARGTAIGGLLFPATTILLALSAWWLDGLQSRGSFAMAALLALGAYQAIRGWAARELVAWTAIAASIVALALVGQARVGVVLLVIALALASRWESRPRPQLAAGLVAVLAVASFAALALGVHRRTANFGIYDDQTYSHQQYNAWRAVTHLTDRHALVFTSQTGEAKTTLQGWDYYPAISDRQVYLAGWLTSALAVHPAELQSRLALNSEVLAGTRAPTSVPGAGAYDRYLAVLRSNEHAPAPFRKLYANDEYTVYEIPSAQ